MKVKVHGAKAPWCQAPRITEGLWGIGHKPVSEDYDFIYANNPPYDVGDEEHPVSPLEQEGFKIFNVLDVPERDKKFNLDKLKEELLKADVVTCISHVTQEQLKRLFDIDSIVIWNPIKDVFVDGVIKNKTELFLYVGRANDPNKRFDLLKGLNDISDIFVVGNEPPKFGDFLGFKSDAELNFLYNVHKFVLLPSKFEGLGLPMLEAMAAGSIPIVCEDNKNSVLCPDFCVCKPDKNSIVDRVSELLEDYDKHREILLEQYSYRIQNKFSKFRIAQNIIDVYRKTKGIYIER